MPHTKVTLREHADIKRIVETAFPSYRKLAAYVGPFYPQNINSYWDGGSKSEFAIVDLGTFRRYAANGSSHPYFDVTRAGVANAETDAYKVDHVGNVTLKVLPPNCALVEAGTFCGKPATARVSVNPENLPKWLTA